ncbi:hypothetical protein JYU34_002730 [Plutella xylostella]|uniref:Protein kinase domain-containing protein n=1 Tax=Plutella xylostella TaxID=51655 RepID=A0ABQ7R302_PLUXY|nr:hypothetical protein JYU34_002730 [Plutella xylostella]
MRIRNHTHVPEKAKGKKRRLRDYAERLARVPREETRADVDAHSNPTKVLFPGACEQLSCGPDAACMPTNDHRQHYCLCTENGQPPTEDYKCPRNTVPLTPKPIYNVIPPRSNNSNSSTHKYTAPAPTPPMIKSVSVEEFPEVTGTNASMVGAGVVASANAGALAAAVAVGGALVLLLLASIVICYMRRRFCVVAGKTQPRVRPGEPLIAERYIRNPHYGFYRAGTMSSTGTPGLPANGNGDDNGEPHVPLLDRNALTFLEEVGEGCFGKVHKGILRTNNGEEIVAVKVLKESAGRSAEEDFVREVSIMSAFRHPNILTLLGVVYRDDTSSSPWMVFEYMEWGDLAGVLRGARHGGRGPALDAAALLLVARQVARGMQYLAARRFVHRDLAARNCLVGARLAVKIADFGMSRDVYTCDYYKMGGERPMPVRWMSPESIIYARFTHESDVWSFGVVLWEIYSRGKQPFYGHNNDGATKLILQGIVLVPPEDCPRFACDLMRCCWRSDPKDRISFDEICSKLEAAAATDGPAGQARLPRPPPQPQDSAGYLIPVPLPPPDYLAALPDADDDLDSASSEEEDEYT